MARKCSTCQHIKRAEIDRRMAAGEPGGQIARDYDLIDRACTGIEPIAWKLASSNVIMKEVSRGTAAVACLPTKGRTSTGLFRPGEPGSTRSSRRPSSRGSLQVALSGLNAIRQMLDSLSRLSGFDRQGSQVNVAVQTNINLNLAKIAERVINKFDQEPELKARIAQALLEIDNEPTA